MGILNKIWTWFGSWGERDGELEPNRARRDLLGQLGAVEQLANRIVVGIIAFIFIYAMGQADGLWWPTFSILGDFIAIFGVLIGVMIAFVVLGGFLGFLFGIPRLLSHAGSQTSLSGANADAKRETPVKSDSERAARRFFSSNTNLEEISDWITKIIVGLSLVQAGTIFEKIKKAAAVFKASALPDTAGADIVFVLIVVAASITGFLLFYMETRTRITLMFGDLEVAADEVGRVAEAKDVKAILNAPIAATLGTEDGSVKPVAPGPIEQDKKILEAKYEDLKTADDLAAWASAQARANNFEAAIRALNDAITKKPEDKDLLVRLADVQQRRGNSRAAYFSIAEARQKSNDDPELLKRELLAALYLPTPESFRTALAAAQKLEELHAADDAWTQLWIACAHGQKYRWLGENNGSDDDKTQTRADALAALRRVDALEKQTPDSGLRQFLRQLLDPASTSIDDDLRVFSSDPDFEPFASS